MYAEARAAGIVGDLDEALRAIGRAMVELRSVAGPPLGRTAMGRGARCVARPVARRGRRVEALAQALEPVASASSGLRSCAAARQRTRQRGCARSPWRIRAKVCAGSTSATVPSPSHWTPLDVGAALAARIEAQQGVWVFTSATLAVGDDFSHFLDRIGIGGALTRVLPSPFDYAKNARIFVPQGLPDPATSYTSRVCSRSLWPLVEAARGGAFLLFTSYRALQRAEDWIARRAVAGAVLVQGRGSRSELLKQFRADGNAILLGTGSFWQGVDVRGPALRFVMIDKLPFAVPSDPLVQARAEAIRRLGGDPFNELQLPQAVLTLKQGVGRLIRDFDDRGLVVLGDPRLRSRGYGKTFLASLPPDAGARRVRRRVAVRHDAWTGGRAGAAAVALMNLLGIETSSAIGSVALQTAAGVLSCARLPPRASRPSRCSSWSTSCSVPPGSTLEALDGIAFGRGPGSFTGLRVSAAVAQGLGAGERRAVLPVSSLLCLAERAWRQWRLRALPRVRRRPHGRGLLGGVGAHATACSRSSGRSAWARRPRSCRQAVRAGRRSARGSQAPAEAAGAALGGRGRVLAELQPSAADLFPQAARDLAVGRGRRRRGALPVYLREHTAWRRRS